MKENKTKKPTWRRRAAFFPVVVALPPGASPGGCLRPEASPPPLLSVCAASPAAPRRPPCGSGGTGLGDPLRRRGRIGQQDVRFGFDFDLFFFPYFTFITIIITIIIFIHYYYHYLFYFIYLFITFFLIPICIFCYHLYSQCVRRKRFINMVLDPRCLRKSDPPTEKYCEWMFPDTLICHACQLTRGWQWQRGSDSLSVTA